MYFNKNFNDMIYQIPRIFPNRELSNLVIYINGPGDTKGPSSIITDFLPDLNMQHSGGQGFPLYTYEKLNKLNQLPGMESNSDYVRKDNITDWSLSEFRKTYDTNISKEDIFYYVYGVLHSPEYKQRFASDLKKMLPRIPFAQDFWAFSKAGRQLADWHLNYETVEPYPLKELSTKLDLDSQSYYRVQKMTFGKSGGKPDKTTIVYNSHISLQDIPLAAYEYVVNGKSALEWIIERYAVTVDKDSGIKNDPNDWSDDPTYIFNLVKRIVRVSLETMQIVNKLPSLNEQL